MDNLSQLLKKIKNTPSLYLGKASISCLQAFLSGYNVAQYQLGVPLKEENALDGFQEWIQKKLNIDSSQSWANIILFFSQDERDALNSFFELFEEFCQSKVGESGKVRTAHPKRI
ncbi:hypothetical protein QUB68_25315 [Microcoleus sp. A006_D1]|uniref:hypothetical protein n=1 Tax=Microcoleus sp. A006_D1 TaxID=3055267 RepID=UPI002FD04271